MNAVSLNNLWSYLQGLSLTKSNRQWLAAHLIEVTDKTRVEKKENKIVFPKIPANYKPSDKVMEMTLGELPSDVNLENELKDRWQEWTK